MPTANNNTDYINTTDYAKLESKIKTLTDRMNDLMLQNTTARNIRYVEIDVEAERARGKIAPDELLIPQHIVDTNIRREQSAYVKYITQSPRAFIFEDLDYPQSDTTLIEKDVTKKVRFDGWQLSYFACIDGFQQNGYGVLELVMDQSQPGELAHEFVQLGDFGIPSDCKNVQEAEMTCRNYYFSRTKLLQMCLDGSDFIEEQVRKVIEQQPSSTDNTPTDNVGTDRDKSLFKIQKVMFRINGIVHVAWSNTQFCNGWLRNPRPLYIGWRKPKINPSIVDILKSKLTGTPLTDPAFETNYPYFLFPYLISENNNISQLKGRAYLDQDTQQAAMSLISSFCTAHRRASGLYFSKKQMDPNDDVLMQKNVFFKQGTIINGEVQQFQLSPPDSSLISAVNLIVSANQQETSQVNFAANNRKDSRKTAAEIHAATGAEQALSTVQVVLFSLVAKSLGTRMFDIIRSRVLAGLLEVPPELKALYARRYSLKPSGDIDVIERERQVNTMVNGWAIFSQTPIAPAYLMDLVAKLFPEQASRYIAILQQAQQQAQSQQAQQQQQFVQGSMVMAKGIVDLSKHQEYFSDIGKIHALPAIKQAAQQIEDLQKMAQSNN